jgi:hypothetical protein
MSAVRAVIVVAAVVLGACAGGPVATPFQPVIPAFQADTCDELAREFATITDGAMRAVIEGPDMIADEQKSVLIKRMQTLLAVAVTEQARKSGVVGTCAMPGWLQQAEHGFSNELRESIGKAAYDGSPVIDYQAWLLELSSDLRAAGMGRG